MAATAIPSDLFLTRFGTFVLNTAQGISFFNKNGIVGKTSGSVILHVDAKGTIPQETIGNTVKIPLLGDFKAAPVMDDDTLTDNEEKLVYSASSATLHAYRKATKTTGKYNDNAGQVKIMKDAGPKLARWRAAEFDRLSIASVKLDGVYVQTGTIPYNGVVFPNGKTSFAALDGTDLITGESITALAAMAKTRGIPPVVLPGYGEIDGVLLITPGQWRDLLSDENWLANQRAAQPRSEDHPIFRGKVGIMSNIVVHCPTTYNRAYGSTLGTFLYQDTANAAFDKAEAIFLGGNAIGYAVSLETETGTRNEDNYGWVQGISNSFIAGFVKTTIDDGDGTTTNIHDYATMYLATAANKIYPPTA